MHRDRVDAVFGTSSYFEGVYFAAGIRTQAVFFGALMRETRPPSTVFAAYNHLSRAKDIRIYQVNDHEGGGSHNPVEKTKLLGESWR